MPELPEVHALHGTLIESARHGTDIDLLKVRMPTPGARDIGTRSPPSRRTTHCRVDDIVVDLATDWKMRFEP